MTGHDDTGPVQMTVRDTIKVLTDLPPDAYVIICAHEFDGMGNQGWYAQAFEPSKDGRFVLIEGASPPPRMQSEVPDARGE